LGRFLEEVDCVFLGDSNYYKGRKVCLLIPTKDVSKISEKALYHHAYVFYLNGNEINKIYIEDREIELPAKGTLCIQPGKRHKLVDYMALDFLILIDKGAVESSCNDKFKHYCSENKVLPRDQSLLLFIKEHIKEVTEKRSNHLEVLGSIESALVGKLTRLRHGERSKGVSQLNSYQVNKAIEFMHHCIHHRIKLSDICEDIGMSPSQFSKKFSEEIGESPMKYFENLRLMRASRMLSDTEKKIIEVAQECGFRSQSYFSRQFKFKFGMTPKKYRFKKKDEAYKGVNYGV